jgi:hypothetical protein
MNLAKQVQGPQTLAHAQVALTDVFLKYVIPCVVESLEDALPGGGSRQVALRKAGACCRGRNLEQELEIISRV